MGKASKQAMGDRGHDMLIELRIDFCSTAGVGVQSAECRGAEGRGVHHPRQAAHVCIFSTATNTNDSFNDPTTPMT